MFGVVTTLELFFFELQITNEKGHATKRALL